MLSSDPGCRPRIVPSQRRQHPQGGEPMPAVESPPIVTPEAIFDIASGFMAAKHLFVANEVGLFEQLAEGPATLDDLAQRTGIATERVRILADAMCALGLVERDGDRYRNGPVAAAFLSGTGP